MQDEFPMICKLLAAGGWVRIFIDDKGVLHVHTSSLWQVLPASTELHEAVIEKMDDALFAEVGILITTLRKRAEYAKCGGVS